MMHRAVVPPIRPISGPLAPLVGVERARARFDVAAPIVARYDTMAGEKRLELSPSTSRALIASVDAVLEDGADVQPIVNRSWTEAVRMLTTGDALRTRGGRTDPKDEVRLGMTSSTSGPGVVYGSVHISSTLRDADTGARLVNTGQTMYGPVALVLKPETLQRATLTPRDSRGADHLIPPDALSRAFAESLTHRALNRAASDPRLQPLAAGRALVPAAVRDILTGAGISGGSATDPSTGFQEGTPEAQFYGGIRPSDVREIRLSASPPEDMRTAIRDAAERWGIPVVVDNKVVAHGNRSEWGEIISEGGDVPTA